MQIDCDYSDADYVQAILMSLRENRIQSDANVRLIVYIRSGDYEEPTGAASVACAADARASTPIDDQGAHAAVSTWLRMDDAIMPPRIRTGANYHSTQFGYLEARRNGYDEAIFLTCAGKISQGANSCFAMVRKGAVVAPPVTPLILDSVTRSTLLELAAAELGLPVEERQIDRSELYAADEAFFCSSSHEVRPVLSVDRLPIGDGCVGPITRRLWETYQAVVRGRSKTRAGWLTPLFKPGYA
jgi:branched-chain amino acid aminotransferase